MFSRFIVTFIAILATVSAFAPSMHTTRAISKTLVMGTLPETFRFKKIMNRFTFKTLAEAIEVAGLTDALSGGSLTIFAPHDNGFAEYFEAVGVSKEDFLADKEKLANILKYHAVDGVVDGKALATAGKLTTLQGAEVAAVMDGDRAFMNDEAKVETTDVEADNGIFHIVDYPLSPPK